VVPPEMDGSAGNIEALERRIRALEERLRQEQESQSRREGQPGPLLGRLLTPEVRKHLRAAQRERLLAVRALVDGAIKRTEDTPPDQRSRRPESVRID